MSKIIGNTVGTTMLRPNWEETDERSSAYIGNKPTADDGNFLVGNGKGNLKEMTPEEVLSHINGASVTTMTTEEYEALSEDEFNANTLYVLTDGEEVSIEDIPNLYVWKKYTAGYSLAKKEVTNQDISYDGSMANQGWDEVKYSDSYEIQDNKIVLINPITVTLSNANKDVIVGKYIYASYLNSYYEIPSTSAVNYHNSTVYKSIRVDKANKLTVELVPNETKLVYVSSKSFSAYPTSGEHTDGYWYEYYRQLGDAAVVDDSSVSFAETDPTVPAWAKAANKPTYTASEVGARPDTWMPTAEDVGALPDDTVIPEVPTKVSAFTNDVGYLTEHQSLEDYAKTADLGALAIKDSLTASEVGALPDTTVIPTVPTKVSAFTNDAGYLTEHQSLVAYAKTADLGELATKDSLTASEVGADASGTAASVVASHNTNTSAHTDIRNTISQLSSEKVDKSGLTLGVHTDGFVYIFVNGAPQGNGLDIKTDIVEGDVFGYIDENNNIVLNGSLVDGTYSVKYEMDDGSVIDIGNLEVDNNIYYIVDYTNLTNCTIDNTATQAIGGKSYTATITANDGYELSSVVVTMDGDAVTVTDGVINIGNVTGNIVITAVAEEINVNNLADSTSADWASGSRISSSGTVKNDSPGFVVTNYIPATKGQTIHIKNAEFVTGYNQGYYTSSKESKEYVTGSSSANLISYGQIVTADYDSSVTLFKNIGQYNTDPTVYAAWADNIVYVRLTIKPTGAESDIIIRVDENIE